MPPTKKKQKVAVKKEYEAETDDEEEKGEHDHQKQKAAVKEEYGADTDDEEEEEEDDDHTSESDSGDSESSEDTAAKEEYEREQKEHEKKWTEKWERLKEPRLKDIAKRKKDLVAGNREKVTYVWHLCTKHPEEYERCGNSFGVGKRGFLIVLKKESYEFWHKILLNLKNCQTWSDVRDLGDDVYAAVHERSKYISSFNINSEEDEQVFSPNDSDVFDMVQVDVFGDSDYDNIQPLGKQHFPIAITHLMYDDLPDWMHGHQFYNDFYSSFSWNSDICEFDPKDVDFLLEDIILGGDSTEHQPGLEDFLEQLLKVGY